MEKLRCAICGKEIRDSLYYTDSKDTTYCLDCMLKNNPEQKNQSAKADSGKPNLTLVPTEIIYEIEKVRSFGVEKYHDPDNWKQVEMERYHQALLRHTLAIWDDVCARDVESGLLHLSHIATNVAFILELLKDEGGEKE